MYYYFQRHSADLMDPGAHFTNIIPVYAKPDAESGTHWVLSLRLRCSVTGIAVHQALSTLKWRSYVSCQILKTGAWAQGTSDKKVLTSAKKEACPLYSQGTRQCLPPQLRGRNNHLGGYGPKDERRMWDLGWPWRIEATRAESSGEGVLGWEDRIGQEMCVQC